MKHIKHIVGLVTFLLLSSVSLPTQAYESRFNPFDIDYNKREWGVGISFVQKWYKIAMDNGGNAHVNWWGDPGKMSGFRMGVPYQPYFGYGFGMNTGFYYEMFFNDGDGTYEEMDFYMPIHLLYRLPILENFSVYINGGFGMDLTFWAGIADGDDEYELDLGGDYMPNVFNLYGEIGAGIQYKAVTLSIDYSMGMLNNDGFRPGYKTKPYKWGINLLFMF